MLFLILLATLRTLSWPFNSSDPIFKTPILCIILKTPPQKPISTSINDAYTEISSPQVIFAKYVLEDRWPEYEKIVKDINGIVEYAINVLNEPWEEKEKFFNTDIYPLQFPLEYGRLNPIEEYKRFFKHELQERQA